MKYTDFLTQISQFKPGSLTGSNKADEILVVSGPTGPTGPGVSLSDGIPTGSSQDGQLWFNTSDGALYLYFEGKYIGL